MKTGTRRSEPQPNGKPRPRRAKPFGGSATRDGWRGAAPQGKPQSGAPRDGARDMGTRGSPAAGGAIRGRPAANGATHGRPSAGGAVLGKPAASGAVRGSQASGAIRGRPAVGGATHGSPAVGGAVRSRPSGFIPDSNATGPRQGDGVGERHARRKDSYVTRDLLAGRNPVIEALKAGRPINRILMQKGEREGSARMIETMARGQGIVVQQADKATLDRMLGGSFHQGVIAFVAAKEYTSLEDIAEAASASGEPMLVVVADGVEDPHNLGAIIRTAEAVGAHGVVIPKRRAVGLTAIVAKSSAGAIEHVRIARVANIAEAIKELKNRGAWIIGADVGAELDYTACDMRGDIALVVGGEGQGLGKAALGQCDYVARLPMRGRVTSLNASIAASVLMYEALRQRGPDGR